MRQDTKIKRKLEQVRN